MLDLTCIGRLGSDPESRSMPNGDNVVNFNVASSFKRSGEEQTTWLRVVAFGKLADVVAKCKKGEQHYFRGRLTCRKWETSEGEKRESWEMILNSFQFLPNKGSGDSGNYSAPPANYPPPADEFDDDLPF